MPRIAAAIMISTYSLSASRKNRQTWVYLELEELLP
jgi:hypothetical protein